MRFKLDCQQELTVVSVEPWCNRDFFGLRKDGLESWRLRKGKAKRQQTRRSRTNWSCGMAQTMLSRWRQTQPLDNPRVESDLWSDRTRWDVLWKKKGLPQEGQPRGRSLRRRGDKREKVKRAIEKLRWLKEKRPVDLTIQHLQLEEVTHRQLRVKDLGNRTWFPFWKPTCFINWSPRKRSTRSANYCAPWESAKATWPRSTIPSVSLRRLTNLFGLRPGFAVDLMVSKNSKGDHWDLSKDTDQRELRRLLKKEKPLFLVGSPPCGPFSPLQNLSKYKRTDEENQQILEEGRMHLKVAVDCYLEQHNHGRFFLHEHPKPSASWQEPEIERLASLPGVYKVESPMCKWEMVAEDQQGVGYVRKDTCWLTNSPEMAKCIEGKCEGGHRHVHLINGRARAAQTYPPKLVSAILDGIRRELRVRGELSTLAELTSGPSPDDTSNEQTESFVDETVSDYVDSVTGMPLDPVKVLEARKEEMKWVEKQQLWDVVPTTMCWEETNRPPITLKWVDRNKGDDSHPNYRSRLVVREVKKASKSLAEFESFSAMPPLESLKVLCALMVSKRTSKRNRPYKMMLIDISRAHFYGESKRRVFCTTRGSLRAPQTLNVRDAGCCQHLAIYIRAVADGEQLQTVQSMAGTVHPWWNGLAFHRSWWWLHLPWWRWSFEVSRRMLKEEVWISCGWLDWSRRRRWYVNVRTQ